MKFLAGILLLLFFQFPNLSQAQLCSGSLGDPVVNITFGTSAGNSGFNAPPGYTYISSSCPNDGQYTITTVTSSCWNGTWHTVANDHTGNGAFMLVNASFQPSDFFLATVDGLCPNTSYEFSAWILNVLIPASGIEPNLTFTIETATGTILNSFNTGNIQVSAQPAWQPFGFNFTTASNQNSVVLRIKNNAPGGLGNDLGLDDITFRPCGPKVTTTIQGNTDTVNVCIYDQSTNYVLNGTASPGFVSPVYQWQISTNSGNVWTDIPGAIALTFIRQSSSAGNFWYRLTTAESVNAGIPGCRINSNRLTINVYPRPAISAGPDKVVLAGKITLLAASAAPNLIYNWSPPDNLSDITILNPIASPQQDTWYTIDAISQQGCVNADKVMVKVVKSIYVPSGFTPNNDGINDNWRIPFLDPSWGTMVTVFNRYGQVVYSTPGTVNWDGRLNGEAQPSGTYVYVVRFADGWTPLKGLLHLIR